MEQATAAPQRNYGIDLARILSMLAVIVLHLLRAITVSESCSAVETGICLLLQCIALPAVNVFILISGFVGYRENRTYPKLKNIISLFCTVVFWGVLITAILKCIFPEQIGFHMLIRAFLPITTKQYWFFTAYFAMIAVSPALHILVRGCTARDARVLMLAVAVLFSAYSFLGNTYSLVGAPFSDPFQLNGGFAFAWFAALYVCGALIKKFALHRIAAGKKVFLCWFSLLILLFGISLLVVLCGQSNTLFPAQSLQNILFSYSSPFVFGSAVCLLLLFAKLDIRQSARRVVSFFAPTVFGVYLIHDHTLLKESLPMEKLSAFSSLPPALLPLLIPAAAAVIFLICGLAEQIRARMFRLLRIDALIERFSSVLTAAVRAAADSARREKKKQ